MIFVSDLDKTLIFSKRFLPSQNRLLLAELKDNLPVAFMAEDTFNNLKEFTEQGGIFIPATARTLEQYKRIFLFDFLDIKYEIICNGKTILKNGKVVQEWEDEMNKKLGTLPISISELLEDVKDFANIYTPDIEKTYYLYDNYLAIISFKNKEDLTNDFIELLNNKIKNTGWFSFACGRKLYISSNFIDKSFAVDYINNNLLDKPTQIVASGDSLYDLKMLENSNFPIIPKHAEIANKLHTTKDSYYEASVEITKELLEINSNN